MRKIVRRWIERAAVAGGYAFLAWTPLFVVKPVMASLADLWRLVERRRRDQAVENAMRCLEIDRDSAERVVRDNYRHLACFAIEVARLARIGPKKAVLLMDPAGVDELMREARAAKRGLVVVSGHLGNWECACLSLSYFVGVKAAIARRSGKSVLLSEIHRLRERCGMEVWEQSGALRKAMRSLRSGEGFVALVDEDAPGRGKIAPFFGRNAYTFHFPVEAAVRSGSPLIAAGLMRVGGLMRFRAVSGPVRWPDKNAEPQKEVERLLRELNGDLADIIREYPEQWFWRKNRWKSAERG